MVDKAHSPQRPSRMLIVLKQATHTLERAASEGRPARRWIRAFAEIGVDDVATVGGKNASLGELYRKLTPSGANVPNGFAITADAYRYVLDSAGAWPKLHEALDGLDPADVADLARRGRLAREA